MRIALLSDIHGNLAAFDAVLADVRQASVDQIVFLGDVATLGPHPSEVVELLRRLQCPCVLGNHESYQLNLAHFLQEDHADWAKETIAWGVSQLSPQAVAFLKTFQPHVEIQLEADGSSLKLLCVHGSPASFNDMLLSTTPADELDNLLAGQTAAVVACGHTHVPMTRRHRDALIVNAGSVGAPMEEMPFTGEPRLMPWAEYAIVDYQRGQLSVASRRISYNLSGEQKAAFVNGMPYASEWVQRWRTD